MDGKVVQAELERPNEGWSPGRTTTKKKNPGKLNPGLFETILGQVTKSRLIQVFFRNQSRLQLSPIFTNAVGRRDLAAHQEWVLLIQGKVRTSGVVQAAL